MKSLPTYVVRARVALRPGAIAIHRSHDMPACSPCCRSTPTLPSSLASALPFPAWGCRRSPAPANGLSESEVRPSRVGQGIERTRRRKEEKLLAQLPQIEGSDHVLSGT